MHRCQRCTAVIKTGDTVFRVNTRATGPIYRCLACGLTPLEVRSIAEDRYDERYADLNKRIATEEF